MDSPIVFLSTYCPVFDLDGLAYICYPGKFAGHPSPGFGGLMSPQMHHGHGGSSQQQQVAARSTVTRVLPPRAWAAAVPTLLTHEAFDVMCTPCPALNAPAVGATGGEDRVYEHCPLERFMGSVYLQSALRRCLADQQFRVRAGKFLASRGFIMWKTYPCEISLHSYKIIGQKFLQNLHHDSYFISQKEKGNCLLALMLIEHIIYSNILFERILETPYFLKDI